MPFFRSAISSVAWKGGGGRLFQSEELLQASVNAGESHEGEGEERCRDQCDGYAFHALWDGGELLLLTQAGEEYERKAEAYG